MKKILGFKLLANLTFVILLIGTIVFTFGFGSTIYLARKEVKKQTDQNVNEAVSMIQTYVDGQLQRVEDVAYTLISSKFGGTVRNENGDSYVAIDPNGFKLPTEVEVFQSLEHFINATPHICGVAIGFEPQVYADYEGQYGFAAYVTNVSGHNERLELGKIHDFHKKEWYEQAMATDAPYWSRPFRETSQGKVVACFSLPLHGYGGRKIGVIALDIDTEAFRRKCDEVSLFPGAEVTLVDREFRFISHTDSTYLLKSISEVGRYSSYTADDSMKVKMMNHQSGQYVVNEGTDYEAIFYFAPIERTGWTISIECPKDEVYSSVKHMKKDTSIIGLLSMLFMLVCLILVIRRVQKVTISKAGIERDLLIASSVQMGMLPKLYPAFPEREDVDIYGFLKPAKTVGGDLYDYFIHDEKLFFCIGDVSGKGVPASLFMAVIRALFRNVSLHTDDPAEILDSLNTAIAEGNTHNMFCTMFLGVLDLKTGHLDYCNAGHNAPIIRRIDDDGKIDVHYANPKVNIAVGVMEGFPYVKEEAYIKKGEAIFLYTDGVTEAENAQKQLFGEEATLRALAEARAHHQRSAKEFVEYVYGVVKGYAGNTEQSDDITMVVVEYKGESAVAEGKKGGNTDVLMLQNDIEQVPALGKWIEGVGERFGIALDKVFQINLALEEAVVNVMNYAYPGEKGKNISLSATDKGDRVEFILDDEGVEFDPTAKEDPDITLGAEERPIGGLGIMLVKQIMDSVSYRRENGHNILTMIKNK